MIIFDIGGTKTRIAFADNFESFETPKIYPTPQNYEEGLELFINTVKECANGREVGVIAGGVAGLLNKDREYLTKSRNLQGWENKNFKEDLKSRLGADINIENDSAMVALGEAHFGAGKLSNIMAYITVSTGVGGARIVEGKIDEKSMGFEPGHQIIDIENNRTLEDLVSGRSLKEKTGKNPKDVTDPEVWKEHAKILAIGLNNIIANWSPDTIVLGGSMITGDPAIPIEKTVEYLKAIIRDQEELPTIKKAELADLGGIYGSLAYIKQIIE